MLLNFSIENFLSYKNRTTFTMLAESWIKEDRRRGHTIEMLKTAKDENGRLGHEIAGEILRTSAIYGWNASWKTNFFHAISTLKDTVLNSFKNDRWVRFMPYWFKGESWSKPTVMEIEFYIEDTIYTYAISVARNVVLTETLSFTDVSPDKQRWRLEPKIIYKRTSDSHWTCIVEHDKSTITLQDIDWTEHLSNKFLLLSFPNLNVGQEKILQQIWDWFKSLSINASLEFWDSGNFPYDAGRALHDFKTADREGFDEFSSMLNIIDSKIDSIALIETIDEQTKEKFYKVELKHSLNQQANEIDVNLPFSLESSWTIRYLRMMPELIKTVRNWGILIVDELERTLHPLVAKKMIEWFLQQENSKSQIIWSSHNPFLMWPEALRRDEVWFVDKDEDLSSQLSRLTQYPTRRNEDRITRYLLWKYNGIPN